MRYALIAAVICLTGVVAYAEDAAPPTCGQVLVEQSKYPKQLAETVTTVADMMDAHAKWIGAATPAAKAESAELTKLGKMHRELVALALKISAEMAAQANLANAAHDMKTGDKVMAAMAKHSAAARAFGTMLIKGADEADAHAKKAAAH